MDNTELGYRLREHRKIRKLTQQEVADLTNVSLKTIQRYEKGQSIPESYLHIFGDKLKLEASDRNELNLLHIGALKNKHKEIQYYITEILKVIGYEITKIGDYAEFNVPNNYIIKNNITEEYYLSSNSPYDFDYSNAVFSFLKSIVEEDLKQAKPIPLSEVNFYLSNDYKDLISHYNVKKMSYEAHRLLSLINSDASPETNPSLEEIEEWKENELKKLKEKFLKNNSPK